LYTVATVAIVSRTPETSKLLSLIELLVSDPIREVEGDRVGSQP
jgi:hypothetical protein